MEAITNNMRDSDEKRQHLCREAENSNTLASIGRLAAGVAHETNNPLSIINQKTALVQDLMEFSEDFAHKKAMEDAFFGIQNSVERCKKNNTQPAWFCSSNRCGHGGI